MSELDPSIFKAYDIRGIYPDQLSEDGAYKIGTSFAKFLNAKKVIVGQDARLSSRSLSDSIIRSLADSGVDVVDIGLCSTPMMLFACAHFNFDGGIMVTASHNPIEYNGFKLVSQKAMPISQESGLEEIKKMALEKHSELIGLDGSISKKDVLDDYLEDAFKRFNPEAIGQFKIVADAGNGMAGMIFPKFFERLNCQVIPLYWKTDGSFPNHLANPQIKETLKDCQAKILEEKADLGIATDGDGDRIFFLDEKAEVIECDLIVALIAQMLLKNNPGMKVIFDVPASQVVKETILFNKGIPIVSKVGHSFFKLRMKKEDIPFGGESSGHFYLKNDSYREAPFVIILHILKILTDTKRTMSSIIAPFQKYVSSGEINFDVKDKEAALKEIEKHYYTGEISHTDGLSIEYEEWNFNLRPSNTEPLLRLNMEADNQELLMHKIDEIKGLMKQY